MGNDSARSLFFCRRECQEGREDSLNKAHDVDNLRNILGFRRSLRQRLEMSHPSLSPFCVNVPAIPYPLFPACRGLEHVSGHILLSPMGVVKFHEGQQRGNIFPHWDL